MPLPLHQRWPKILRGFDLVAVWAHRHWHGGLLGEYSRNKGQSGYRDRLNSTGVIAPYV